jgi:sec-independent protein translocase protein TatC
MTAPTEQLPDVAPEPGPPPQPQRGYAGGPEMTLVEHLLELRNRVLISGIAVVVGMLVCLFFWQTIFGWLLAPAREEFPDFRLSSFSPTDRIQMVFKIGIYGGFLLASPVVVYEMLAFIVPGLTPRERTAIFPGMIGATMFLLGGMAFAYWVILPASLGFLLDFGSEDIQNVIGIKQYMDFVLRVIFWVGISFELPMVMALLGWLGVVTARQLLKFWRYAIVLCFVLAAIVTPTPDPLTQSLVGGPLIALYLLGIGMAWFTGRRHRRVRPEALPSVG